MYFRSALSGAICFLVQGTSGVESRCVAAHRIASRRVASWRTGNDVKVHPGARERARTRASVPPDSLASFRTISRFAVGHDLLREILLPQSPRSNCLSSRARRTPFPFLPPFLADYFDCELLFPATTVLVHLLLCKRSVSRLCSGQ